VEKIIKVKFIDLKSQYLSIKREIDEAIQNVLNDSAFTLGSYVESFEKNFAEIHNAKYCTALNSGTSALHASMMALNIGSGDEVLVPVNTFFATPLSAILVGAKPVFIDCESSYYNIDVEKIEKSINKNTKAIVPVHLYGQPARMDKITDLAKKYGLFVIEDCAQAHLAEYSPRGINMTQNKCSYNRNSIPPGEPCGINEKENKLNPMLNNIPLGKGSKVGTFGDIGCFSFYPGKNLGAYGEGGAILTNNESLYRKIKVIRNIGMDERYHHDIIGHNFRMEGIQGAILDIKLKYLEEWTIIRRKNVDLYRQLLENCDEIILPSEMPGVKHVYHLFVIRAKKRNHLMNFLNKNGIETGLHYPIPCHLQNACKYLGYKTGDFPVAEKLADEILSLPMSEQLKEHEIQYVCEKIKEFYTKS